MKKGFTLIELLAVIVILAIIAMIATPIILNIIEDSRRSAAIQSTNLYVDGLQTKVMAENISVGLTPELCVIDGEEVICDTEIINYETTGKVPQYGYVKFNNGVIEEYSVCINGYVVTDGEATSVDTCEITVPDSNVVFNGTKEVLQDVTYIAVVYFDPTDLSKVCTSADVVDVTSLEDKTGCMRFYIYRDTGLTYRMILDRNTSGDVAWNSNNDSSVMKEVDIRLKEDTKGWKGSPRLITADEIAKIVGADVSLKWDSSKSYSTSDTANIETRATWFYFDGSGDSYTGWHTQVSDSEHTSNYAWLFNYIRSCEDGGCTVGDNTKYPTPTKTSTTKDYIEGYWTSTPVVGQNDNAWYVTNSGRMRVYDVDAESHNGVRPVITLLKSIVD